MEIQDTNDEDLIRRYYQQDEEALKVLFKRHKDGLFNFALRFCSNRADAEDAVSHTFMMVCQKSYTIKPQASFKTWAYTVARNSCLSKLRSRSRFFPLWSPKKDTEEEHSIDVADPKATVRDSLNDQDIKAMIQKAINKLAEDQKQAFLLREFQGFTYDEISRVLDCSLDNVKVLIFRARNHLKDLLPPELLKEGDVK